MNAIFMNWKSSETSDPHRILLNYSDKEKLRRSLKYVVPSNISIYYAWENIRMLYKERYLKYQHQRETKNLNYLMDHIFFQIFKFISSISSKKWESVW